MGKALSKKAAVASLKDDPANKVAVVSDKQVAAFSMPTGYKVVKVVTMPSLVMKETNGYWVIRVDTPMRLSKVPGKLKTDGTREEPATVAEVTQLDSGEKRILLVPAVLIKNWRDDYPDESYVGKSFAVHSLGKLKAGQRHTDYEILEIASEAEAA